MTVKQKGGTMQPVILSGGSGTRLWPLSRSMFPKQFLPLSSNKSLLNDTIQRISNDYFHPPIVICNQNTRFIVAEHLRETKVEPLHIALEPVARNTAPAIAASAILALQKNEDSILLVLPSDHHMQDNAAFLQATKKAHALAEKGFIVTFGITPTSPNTEYGYIETGTHIANSDALHIKHFKEKPNKELAQEFIHQDHYWNSGMFAFKASVLVEELKKHHPEIVKHAQSAVENAVNDLDFIRLDEASFSQCESISIDYALMEKTAKAVMLPLDANWTDIGSWNALWELHEKDKLNNACSGDVVLDSCNGNYVYAESKLIAATGVDNLIIVDTKDALLIADKEKGNIRSILEKLNEHSRDELKNHRLVYRPWGHYENIYEGEFNKVKCITVNAGASLSTQMHQHRAEHWVVVNGTAEVVKGSKTFTLEANQSIYLPQGVVHSLANKTNTPLEIIEVQTGNYLEEDDIIRLEDKYGRNVSSM